MNRQVKRAPAFRIACLLGLLLAVLLWLVPAQAAPNTGILPDGFPRQYFQFAHIPAGTFMMGSPENEAGRFDDEVQHQVTISRPFEMQTTQVTQALWQAVMGNNPSFTKGADLPVEQVSWNDAQEFISKLNLMLNTKAYRLPTEAEWEYAARAGTTTPYAGSLDAMAWYKDNSDGDTHPVGQKRANAWGLYDVHGNVWEWVQDWYGAYPSGRVTDPTGPSTGTRRVNRGGSRYDPEQLCRSALRRFDDPDGGNHDPGQGFRLARSIP